MWLFSDEPGEQDRDFIESSALALLRPLAVPRENSYRFLADEQRIFALGTYQAMTCHRAITYLLSGMPNKVLLLGLPVLGYFLLGMYLARRGFSTTPARAHSFGKVFVAGGVAGMALQTGGALAAPGGASTPAMLFVFWLCALAGALALAVAYAAGAYGGARGASARHW